MNGVDDGPHCIVHHDLDISELISLFDHGANVIKKQNHLSALHLASGNGHFKIPSYLGTNVDMRISEYQKISFSSVSLVLAFFRTVGHLLSLHRMIRIHPLLRAKVVVLSLKVPSTKQASQRPLSGWHILLEIAVKSILEQKSTAEFSTVTSTRQHVNMSTLSTLIQYLQKPSKCLAGCYDDAPLA